jgi:minor extracellular protease Epr
MGPEAMTRHLVQQRTILGLAAAGMIAIAGSAAMAQSRTSIIEYDKDGRPKGAITNEQRPGATGTPAAPNAAPAARGTAPAAPAPRGPASRLAEGEVVVTNAPAGFEAAAAQMGFRVLERVRLANLGLEILRLSIPARTTVEEARSSLRTRFPGIVADANHLYEPSQGAASAAAPADLRNGSLARAMVGWEQVPPTCGRGIRLGMIDGAVDTTHPAFAGRQLEYKSFHDPKKQPGAASHGTAVAALFIGAPADKGFGGILPGAKLYAANMFEEDGGKTTGSALAMVKGLDWLATEKVPVVNLSISGADNTLLKLGIEKARRTGMALVASVGNDNSDDPAFPAAFEGVVSVTAVSDQRLIYDKANRGDYVDLAAPGVRVWTAVPGGGKYQTGTSFAAPFITALIALDAAKGQSIEEKAVIGRYGAKAIDLGPPGRDKIFGFGLVNATPAC